LSGADFWQHADRQRHGPGFPQQQTFGAAFAQCDEPLPAARDDPHKHVSPPLSPIAIRQVMMKRIGRPRRYTAETSNNLLGIRRREATIQLYGKATNWASVFLRSDANDAGALRMNSCIFADRIVDGQQRG
jgi:hypothetical protein